MSQQKQRHRIAAPRYKTAKDNKPQKTAVGHTSEHKVAWVAASPSLGYASVAGDSDPRELDLLRRTCSEYEREGYRLVSVSALTGVIDPGLGGTGTVGWYLFFVRDVDDKALESRPPRGTASPELPDYLRRARVEHD